MEKALRAAENSPAPFVVVSGDEQDGWHRGVVGIVASRVKEETGKSTAVVSIQGEFAVGSVRGNEETNVVSALDSVSHLLVKYGGHPAAAGFTLRSEQLDQFAQGLADFSSSTKALPVRTEPVDGWATVSEVNQTLVTNLSLLGPYGVGVARPLIAIRGVSPVQMTSRANGALLIFRMREGGEDVEVMWWGHGDLVDKLPPLVDLLGRPGINTYRGRSRVQFVVTALREAEEQE